MIYLVCIF